MKLPAEYQPWAAARQRFHLSHAQIQMARELGMNPKKFGSLANHKQEPWKAPLPVFIEDLYLKRFGKVRPDDIRPLEQIVAERSKREAKRKAAKRSAREASNPPAEAPPEPPAPQPDDDLPDF
jgi:hypothetical protein